VAGVSGEFGGFPFAGGTCIGGNHREGRSSLGAPGAASVSRRGARTTMRRSLCVNESGILGVERLDGPSGNSMARVGQFCRRPQESSEMATMRDKYPLLSQKVIKKTISGSVLYILLLSSFILLGHAQAILNGWILPYAVLFFAICFGVGGLRYLYEKAYFEQYFYDMTDRDITIRKGIRSFGQKEVTLPFSKITDVYVDQDSLDVWFGLYDVHVSSPTATSGTFAHIDGVSRESSQEIKRLILEKINKAG
jgi:membrane protein YdbS with pleckstrin-like domain